MVCCHKRQYFAFSFFGLFFKCRLPCGKRGGKFINKDLRLEGMDLTCSLMLWKNISVNTLAFVRLRSSSLRYWLQSTLTLEVMVYIPASDMSLANPKSPTLATRLASTKIFRAARSRWTNCARRHVHLLYIRRHDWLLPKCYIRMLNSCSFLLGFPHKVVFPRNDYIEIEYLRCFYSARVYSFLYFSLFVIFTFLHTASRSYLSLF